MGKKLKQKQKESNSETKKNKNLKISSIKIKYRSSSKFKEKKLTEKNIAQIISSFKTQIKSPIKKKKKILIPLFKLNKKPPKDINQMNIEELKEFASEFDLNPKVNYKVLEYLKKNSPTEFNKYIEKYKYTLDFEDALNLGCFNNKKVKLILQEFNNNFKNSQIPSLKKIKFLSKLKIFNLFCYLLQLKPLDICNIQSVLDNILEYANPQTLIFKVPNRFGNIELKYYSCLTFIINYFISNIDDNDTNNNKIESNISDFTSSPEEQIYFNWNNSQRGDTKMVDLTDFNARKIELENYFNISDSKNSIKTIPKKTKQKADKQFIADFGNKQEKLNFFKERIMEMVDESDEIILKKIKLIYYGLLFITEIGFLLTYSNCLKTKYNQIEIDKSALYTENNNKILNLAYSNLDNKYPDTSNNKLFPNYKYYSFPDFLEKNIIKNDKELYEDFKKFIKYIYSSEIMKDIFYLNPEFNEFVYPLDNDEIFNEIFEYTIFIPFNSKIICGFTQKEIPEIVIPVYLEQDNLIETNLSKIICQLTQILNATIHEQMKHYLKSLIFYNSFRFNIKKRINSNLYDHGEEPKYIQGILKKTVKIKSINDLKIDGGHKAEIFLYGKILDRIYFYQAIELFKFSNWNLTIIEHIQTFQKINNVTEDVLTCEQISKNQDLSEFIRHFIVKFEEIFHKGKKISDIYVKFEPYASSFKLSSNIINTIEPNKIIFDYNESITIPKYDMPDASC